MSLWGKSGFAVVMFTPSLIRGLVFSGTKSGFAVTRSAEEPIRDGNSTAAWKNVLGALDCGKSMPMYVCGSFSGGIFFRTRSAALGTAEQRSALELELPRHLIAVPQDFKLQFAAAGSENSGQVDVNVYVFPGASLGGIAESLSSCGRQTDGFVYPLMALSPDDPLFYSEELEPGFCFSGGEWHTAADSEAVGRAMTCWKEDFSERFSLPQDLDIAKNLPLLLAGKLIARPDFSSVQKGLLVLPESLRPKRFRRQLQLTVILLIALLVMSIWGAFGAWNSNRSEYSANRKEIARMQKEILSIQTRIRRQSKINKERTKIVGIKTGEQDVLGVLAGISALLPKNVSVSNFRWNENDIDISLVSEVENHDLARTLKSLANWKVGQVQQRQSFGGNGHTINLKLVPDVANAEKKAKGRRK